MQSRHIQFGRFGRRAIIGAMVLLMLVACEKATEPETSPPGAPSPLESKSESAPTSGSSSGPSPYPAGFVDSISLGAALRVADPLERVERVAGILRQATPDQLADVKAAIELAPHDQGDIEYVLFADWWARFDPRAAFIYANGGEVRFESPRIRVAVVRRWAAMDPQGALDSRLFFNVETYNQRNQTFSTELLDAIVVGWFESGQPGLEEFLGGLTDVSDVTRGMRSYARMRVLRDGGREALEWTREPSPFPAAHHRLLLAGALTIIAHSDPQLAIEWIPVAEEDGVDIRTFQMRIAGGWAHHDPEKALEWVSTLTEETGLSQAARRVGTTWMEADPEALAAWLAERDGLDWLDDIRMLKVRREILDADYRLDWTKAMERTEKVVDDRKRRRQLVWNLQHWLILDPPAAEAWIEAHSDALSDIEKEAAHSISFGDKLRLDRVLEEEKKKS